MQVIPGNMQSYSLERNSRKVMTLSSIDAFMSLGWYFQTSTHKPKPSVGTLKRKTENDRSLGK